jgi:outer membrane lipoprotein LolB
MSTLLSGCVNHLALKAVQRTAQYDAPFVLNGRVAIKRGMDNSSAGLRWVHNPEEDEDEVLILEPMGQTMARIHLDAQGATLESQGRFYVDKDVESVTQQALEWSLPLTWLSHWIVGVPAQGAAADIQRDSRKQITMLRQDGWEIRYLRYTGVAADSLPARIVMRKDQLEITILIDEWEKQQF